MSVGTTVPSSSDLIQCHLIGHLLSKILINVSFAVVDKHGRLASMPMKRIEKEDAVLLHITPSLGFLSLRR